MSKPDETNMGERDYNFDGVILIIIMVTLTSSISSN